jgi:putative membrane protein
VPLARLQSLELQQGPLDAALALAEARFHTVSGPVRPRLAAIDATNGVRLFEEVSARAVAAAEADRSHRWGRIAPDEPRTAPAAPRNPVDAPPIPLDAPRTEES